MEHCYYFDNNPDDSPQLYKKYLILLSLEQEAQALRGSMLKAKKSLMMAEVNVLMTQMA